MIHRKEAKALLVEFVEMLGTEAMPAEIEELVATSELVIRGKESVEQKGRRYVTEGRLTVTRVLMNGLIVATCKGSTGEVYTLGHDPRNGQFRCTCPGPATKRCSHIAALQLVVVIPKKEDNDE